MKRILVLLLMLVFVSQAFSQKKKKGEELIIDSLSKVNTELSIQIDSLSQDRDLYYGVYTTIKEKVFKYDYNPTDIAMLIDSIRASSDSLKLGLTHDFDSLKDSLSIIMVENNKLKAALDSLSASESNKKSLVSELEQLKQLLDAQIITQEEFDSKKALILDKWK